MAEEIVLGRYQLLRLIGTGAFSQVYEGKTHIAIDQITSQPVAIKLEDLQKRGTARHEAHLLHKKLSHRGIPTVIDYKRDRDRYIVAMELLGPSVYSLIRENRSKPSLETLYRVMYQTIKIVKYMHRKGYVHTDIKPDNVVIGIQAHQHCVYLIDFGETRKYTAEKAVEYVGNPYFSSTAVLSGGIYGPKDDLEALSYVFGYIATGKLPWIDFYDIDPSINIQNILKYRRMNDLRSAWSELPTIIPDLVDIAQSLGSLEVPNYPSILTQLQREASQLGIHLKSKKTIWDLERPFLKRLDTVVCPLGQSANIDSKLLSQIRLAEKPPTHSNATTLDSLSTADPTMATIVTHQLPVVSADLRSVL